MFLGELILGHLDFETIIDIGVSLVGATASHYLLRHIPSSFSESALPSIILVMGT